MKDVAIGTLHQQLVENGYSIGADELTQQRFGTSTQVALEDFQNRHVGPDGHPLSADGVVGPKTEWALTHQSGPQHSFVVGGWTCEPSSVRKEAAGAVQAAVADIGRFEEPDGSNRGNRIQKYFHAGEEGLPWCAFACSTWLQEASGLLAYWRRTGGVSTMRDWALKHDATVAPENALPGDLWITIRSGGHGHVGLIVHHFGPNQIALIEGNAGNAVRGTVRTPQSATCIARPIPVVIG